jgi:hypothetical protein
MQSVKATEGGELGHQVTKLGGAVDESARAVDFEQDALDGAGVDDLFQHPRDAVHVFNSAEGHFVGVRLLCQDAADFDHGNVAKDFNLGLKFFTPAGNEVPLGSLRSLGAVQHRGEGLACD